MEHKHPTDLSRFVAERVDLIFDGNKNTFTEALYQRLKKRTVRGSSGFVFMVMKGDRPVPKYQEEAWARTLGVLPGTEERERFAQMCADHRIYTVTGRAGEGGAQLLEEVHRLRAENARLKAGRQPRPPKPGR